MEPIEEYLTKRDNVVTARNKVVGLMKNLAENAAGIAQSWRSLAWPNRPPITVQAGRNWGVVMANVPTLPDMGALNNAANSYFQAVMDAEQALAKVPQHFRSQLPSIEY